jgi:hypothetical protein
MPEILWAIKGSETKRKCHQNKKVMQERCQQKKIKGKPFNGMLKKHKMETFFQMNKKVNVDFIESKIKPQKKLKLFRNKDLVVGIL